MQDYPSESLVAPQPPSYGSATENGFPVSGWIPPITVAHIEAKEPEGKSSGIYSDYVLIIKSKSLISVS